MIQLLWLHKDHIRVIRIHKSSDFRIVDIFSVAEWVQRCKGHATGILCGRYFTPAVVLVSYHYLIAAVNQTGDRYAGLISVPGGSSLQTFVLFPTLLHSNKHKKSLKALFLNFQTFLQGTHIEPVGTHCEPPSLAPWLAPLAGRTA